jgi:hypothetical protein
MLLTRAGETLAAGSKISFPQMPHIKSASLIRLSSTPNGLASPEPTELLTAKEAYGFNVIGLGNLF